MTNQDVDFVDDLDAELAEFTKAYQGMTEEQRAAQVEYLKEEFSVTGKQIQELEYQKVQKEAEVKELSSQIKDLKDGIRQKWLPFLNGVDRASIDCHDVVISTEPVLDIKVVDKEVTIDWLSGNGYQGAMKWDLHTATVKKIAKEKYEGDEQITIPGVEYSKFQVVKIKEKKGK